MTHGSKAIEMLACMAASHVIVGNPFFGAGAFLAIDIIKSLYLCDLPVLKKSYEGSYFTRAISNLVIAAGIAIIIIYPYISGEPKSSLVTVMAICLAIRDYSCLLPSDETQRRRKSFWISVVFIQLAAILVSFFLIKGLQGWEYILLLVSVSGLIAILFPETLPKAQRQETIPYLSIGSYRMLTSMTLYSQTALSLGSMMIICFWITSTDGIFKTGVYNSIIIWMIACWGLTALYGSFFRKRGIFLGITEFCIGAVLWILGVIFIMRSKGAIDTTIWTTVWGLGLALMGATLEQFHSDFESVGALSEEGLGKDELQRSNSLVSTIASIVSYAITMAVICLWTFNGKVVDPIEKLPNILRICMLYLPIIFMIAAIVFALRQPFDMKNREKLMNYLDSHAQNAKVKASLKKILVDKYRTRYGMKIICSLARPFLRLKVTGKENISKENFPSVFVCNHGFMYGPIAAVLYLPTYFKPWIHDKMLDVDKAASEIEYSFNGFVRVVGKKIGRKIIRLAARIICWGFNSLEPIPVSRGASRELMKTFSDSLAVLSEGDNILIFPEKPGSRTKDGQDSEMASDSLRTFFTGFAHIGKLYYDQTGKSLLFYPIYADKGKRVFMIGEPVAYDPSFLPKDSKRLLAETLHARMIELETEA